MDAVEEAVLLCALPAAFPILQRLGSSRLAMQLPLLVLGVNCVIFLLNAWRYGVLGELEGMVLRQVNLAPVASTPDAAAAGSLLGSGPRSARANALAKILRNRKAGESAGDELTGEEVALLFGEDPSHEELELALEAVLGQRTGQRRVKAADVLYGEQGFVDEEDELEDEDEDDKDREDEHLAWGAADLLHAGDRYRWAQEIGSVPELKPGALLISTPGASWSHDGGSSGGAGENPDGAFFRTIVLVTTHGGRRDSVGYVMNDKLPKEEDLRARRMLREFGDSSLSERGQDSRQANLTEAIQRADRLWLGCGGPVRDVWDTWTHVHSCTTVEGSVEIAPRVAIDGDIVEILLHERCFVKLLYGSSVWAPGQLDAEVKRGTWLVANSSASLVFDRDAQREHAWDQALSAVRERLAAEQLAGGDEEE